MFLERTSDLDPLLAHIQGDLMTGGQWNYLHEFSSLREFCAIT